MTRFEDSRSVQLDGSGDGEIVWPPVPLQHHRRIARMVTTISTGSASSGGTVKVYVGAESPANLRDGSIIPWLDISEGGIVVVPSSAQLRVVYEGCDPTATATFTIEGTEGKGTFS